MKIPRCPVLVPEDSGVSRSPKAAMPGTPFGGSVHLRMSFRLEVLVVRGLPFGIDQNIPVRDGGGVPDVLRVEFRPAVGGAEVGLVARQFVHFEQVDPFRGESRPEEEPPASGSRKSAAACQCAGGCNGRPLRRLFSGIRSLRWPGKGAWRFSMCRPARRRPDCARAWSGTLFRRRRAGKAHCP